MRPNTFVVLLALLLYQVLLVSAVTKTWVAAAGATDQSWGTATNWSPSGVPAATDDVVIAQVQSGTAVDVITLSATASCNSLTMGDASYLSLGTKTLTVANSMSVAGTV